MRRTCHEASPADRDERALVLRAKQGDQHAREQLIDRLRPCIVSAGRNHRVDGLELDDLVQEGTVGVLEALAHYDPDRGTPFSAYAAWWIRYRQQELRSEFARPLRLPPKALRQLARMKAEQHACYSRERRQLPRDELCTRVGIDREQAEALLRVDGKPCGLDEPLAGQDGRITPRDLAAATGYRDAEVETVLDAIAGRQLCALLERLPAQEQTVLRARFGLSGEPPHSLDEIGRRLGLSGERIRQIEKRALDRLRDASLVDVQRQ